ncbi:MAG TPA: hypothetical protein VM659_14055 [Dongiaceae bacterium]|nr:hypothetical protein [Dongiaceae bacterium]
MSHQHTKTQPKSRSSFREFVRSNPAVKEQDSFDVDLDQLHVNPGWNKRIRNASLEEYIDRWATTFKAGRPVPPLQVYWDGEDKFVVVDGHCRLEGALRARAQGAAIRRLRVMRFEGNDVARIHFMVRSSEGRPLSLFERGMAAGSLVAMGLSVSEIATEWQCSETTIESALLLDRAPRVVQDMLKQDLVATEVVLDHLREHREGAAQTLQNLIDRAKGQGHSRVTAKVAGTHKLGKRITNQIRETFAVFPSVLSESLSDLPGDPTLVDESRDYTLPIKGSLLKALLEIASEVNKGTNATTASTQD